MASRMYVDERSTGSQTIYHNFENIRNLSEYHEYHQNQKCSPEFSLCNSTWNLGIRKERDEETNDLYLAVFLNKVDNEYENRFSYHVEMKVTLLSENPHPNESFQLQGKSSKSRFVFGKRDGEFMGWGTHEMILWTQLLNPEYGFVDGNIGDYIEIELYMEIVAIYRHDDDCRCKGCN